MLRPTAALAAATGLLFTALVPGPATAGPAVAEPPGTVPVSTTGTQYDVSVSPGRVYYANQVDAGAAGAVRQPVVALGKGRAVVRT